MTINFPFTVRNAGAPQPGLTLTWHSLKRLRDGADITSPDTAVPFTDLGAGWYKAAYDAESADGELVGTIDAGASISSPSDRYIDVILDKTAGRILSMSQTTSCGSCGCTTSTIDRDIPGQMEIGVVIGDNWGRAVAISQGGSPLDITGYTWESVITTPTGDTTITVTVVDAPGGQLSLALTSSTTATLSEGNYHWYLRGTSPAAVVRTYLAGAAKVEAP